MVGQFFLNYFALFFPHVLGYATNISPERLIALTNEQRTSHGFSPLTNNSVLNEAARRKAGDMFSLDYWAHNSPTGRTPWVFFKEVGYSYAFAGENLARDFDSSNAVVTAWMESPTHRENILNGDYREIGMAVVNGTLEGVETTLVVQFFGSPIASEKPVSEEPVAFRPKPVLASGEATGSPQKIIQMTPAIGGVKEELPKQRMTIFSVTKTMMIFLVGLIIGVLALDLYLVTRRRISRLAGRSLAHLAFLLFLILAIFIMKPGLIL